MISKIVIFLIRGYKITISRLLVYFFGFGCRFESTCSQYAIYVIEKYGIVKGGAMSIKRIIKCNPWV